MWQNIIRISTAIVLVILAIILIKTTESNLSTSSARKQTDIYAEYLSVVQKFVPLPPASFTQFINGNEFSYVYFGRKTCPECREFVKELAERAEIYNVTIHYINTEDPKTEELKQLINTYNIEFVPTLIKVKKNNFEFFLEAKITLEKFLGK